MAEPPMCSAKELEDGTYSIDDVLDMNIRIMWRANQMQKAQAKATQKS